MPLLKNKENRPINFGLMFFLHYITAALITSQRMTFLIRSGYTIEQRSFIFAAIPLVSISLQLLIGYLSDKYKTIKKIYLVLIMISAITAYMFYNVQTQLFIYHFGLTLLSNSVIATGYELGDVWVLESKEVRNSYGLIRAFGSLGWAVGSFLLAQIILAYGYQGLALVSLVLNILLFAIILIIRDEKNNTKTASAHENVKISDIKLLFKDSNYLLLMSIIFLLNLAANINNYIILEKILLLNGTEWHIGLRMMMAATLEIPFLLMGDRIHNQLKSTNMLIIGTLVYAVQFSGYYLASNTTQIFIATTFQLISLPFFTIAIKYLLSELSPTNLKASGMIIGPAIVNGVLGIFFPLISAFLVRHFTINTPLLLAVILSTLSVILSIHLNNKYNK